ncbi:MAG: VCBS repeat-containing protein, partial [Hymenobacter sp.]
NDLRLADLNEDGQLDLLAVGLGATQLFVGLGNGAGDFAQQAPWPLPGAGTALEVGDVNGDGHADVLAGTLQQVYNDGTGHFTAASTLQTSAVRCVFMRLADFNLDGYLDLLLVDTPGGAYNQLAVMLNDGSGYFLGSTYQALPVEATGVEVGDLDGDGYLDVLLTEHDANTGYAPNSVIQWGLTVLRGNGTTQFTVGPRQLLPARGVSAETLALGDVDADGDLDALTAGLDYGTGATQAVRLFLNNGQGNWQAVAPTAASRAPRSLALADVDGDGDLDLAGDDDTGSLVVRRNGPAVPTPLAAAAVVPAGVTLHPNPAHGQFTLSLPAGLLSRPGTLTLHNALGQRVYEQALSALPAGGQLPLLVPGLPPGLYLLRLAVAGEAPLPLGRVMLE